MSIALDSNRRIVPSVFSQPGRLPPYCAVLNTAAIVPVTAPVVEFDRCSSFSSSSSSSSSSIGKNSDVRSSDDEGDNEAESSYKEDTLGMDSLEEVLPIRRGISNFYNGKSKSFTSLADASSAATIREIAKPENAYSRKRRNLLASNLIWDKNRTSGISKRSISSSRSSLALAVAMSTTSERDVSNSKLSLFRPPVHPNGRASRGNLASAVPPFCKYPTWRSYSMADLH